MVRRIFFALAAFLAPLPSAQSVLSPCIFSSVDGPALRLVFRARANARPRPGRITLLLHLKHTAAPAAIRINGKRTPIISRARGWATLILPGGTAWERIAIEPGAPFDGCSNSAFAPYLVTGAAPRTRPK